MPPLNAHNFVVLLALVCLGLAALGVTWPRFVTFYAGIFFVALVLLGVV